MAADKPSATGYHYISLIAHKIKLQTYQLQSKLTINKAL
jgi:hypothetical protein